jgi:hypothetical protein
MQKIKFTNKLLFTITIIAYLIALIIYGHWNYQYNKNEIVDNIDRELYNYATTLKYILPEDFHDRAIDRQAISIEEDRYITTKLTKLVNETSLKYTYTIIKKGNHLFFVVSDIIADPETKRGTFYFYPYEEADESFINAFDKEEPTYKTVSEEKFTAINCNHSFFPIAGRSNSIDLLEVSSKIHRFAAGKRGKI